MFDECSNNILLKNDNSYAMLDYEESLVFLSQKEEIESNNLFDLEKTEKEVQELINTWLEGIDYED